MIDPDEDSAEEPKIMEYDPVTIAEGHGEFSIVKMD